MNRVAQKYQKIIRRKSQVHHKCIKYMQIKSILSFTPINYTEIYYHKLKFITTYAHKLCIGPFTVKRNVNKGKHAELSHNCKKLMVVHTMLLLLLLSCFIRVRLRVTPQTAAHQAPLSLGFSRQKYWSGLPFPSPMHESEK